MSHPGLVVGYARTSMPPVVGAPLAGVVSRAGRFCTDVHDPLYARAVHVATAESSATLLVADLLVMTPELHRAIAERSEIDPSRLLVSATHTHSGPGAYWDLGRGELFMGAYRASSFLGLADVLAKAVREARRVTLPATVRGAAVAVAGASANRRRLHGPVDPDLSLLRFDVEGDAPIDVVSYSAHPVIALEREPTTCSADFPGEICARLERRGRRAVFFTGAVGGLSPIFPEFPMRLDEHLTLMGDLLERGYESAERALAPIAVPTLESTPVQIPLSAISCRVFPDAGAVWSVAEALVTPLSRWVATMGRDGRSVDHATLHLLRLGEAALLGTPCDLGVRVALALKQSLRESGIRLPLVGSQCNGYVGYVHLPDDYDHVPEPGFRHMAFYENAMSMSGRDTGRAFVAGIRDVLARGRSAA